MPNPPQTHGYISPPVFPQAAYCGFTYQPHPAPVHQPAPLIAHSNTTNHQPTTTYYPPSSAYLSVPQQQPGRPHRASNHNPRRPSHPATSVSYNNPNSVRDWAHGVHPGKPPSTNSIPSDILYADPAPHRGDKRDDRSRRRDEGKSRRGSGYVPSYGSVDEAGSRMDGRSPSRMKRHPDKIRQEPTPQQPVSYHSYCFWGTQRR